MFGNEFIAVPMTFASPFLLRVSQGKWRKSNLPSEVTDRYKSLSKLVFTLSKTGKKLAEVRV